VLSKRKLAKKKRRRKARKAKLQVRNHLDCHHIFYYRKDYKTKTLRELRELPYCKVYLPKDTIHKAIHALVPCVPVPKEVNAREIIRHIGFLEEYKAIGSADSFEKRIETLASLFDCIEQPTADALRAQAIIVHELSPKPST